VSSIAEYIGQVPHAGLLFILVFILNVVPAFAPPTWITLSFLEQIPIIWTRSRHV